MGNTQNSKEIIEWDRLGGKIAARAYRTSMAQQSSHFVMELEDRTNKEINID